MLLPSDRHAFLLAVIFYGLSTLYSVFLWRHGFRKDNRVNYLLIATGFLFHCFAMAQRGFRLSHCPITNLYEATTFIAWAMVGSYLAVGLWWRLRFLGAFLSPILTGIGIFALMPALDFHGPKPEFSKDFWPSLHAALILLAYGAFGLSSVAGIMFLRQEHDLKFRKVRAVFSLLPPIQRLELIMGRLLLGGFLLLTIGLLVGSASLKHQKGVYITEDPKIMWSILVWVIYLVLLVSRWRFAQRGRRFAWGTISGFAFVLLTFWGFNLLSAIHNP